jgi:hypothetical protein
MRKLLILVGALLAIHVAFLFVHPSGAELSAAPDAVDVGIVLDVGGRGDKSFNDGAYAGATRAEKELGAHIRYIEPGDGSDREAGLRLLAAEKMDVVIGVGFIFTDDITQLAKEYPNIKFGDVDYSVGVDKDSLLARLAADSLNLQAGGAAVTCANSLLPARDQRGSARELLEPSSYDVVITNPPFGSKIPVEGELLRGYELAYQWTQDRKSRTWARTQHLRDSAPPQILFIELCWKLLREGGRCGIVVPEGILGNQSAGYIRQWLIERADILAVVDCPLETFMPSTSTKTAIVVFEKRSKPRRPPVFMAIAEKCGHDRRGTPLLRADGSPDDDFSLIVQEWERHRNATSQGAAA